MTENQQYLEILNQNDKRKPRMLEVRRGHLDSIVSMVMLSNGRLIKPNLEMEKLYQQHLTQILRGRGLHHQILEQLIAGTIRREVQMQGGYLCRKT
jgi:hypothetical protein